MDIILKYGIGGIVLFGGGFYLLNFIKNKNFSALSIFQKLFSFLSDSQKQHLENIESIDRNQVKVQATIKNLEKQQSDKQVAIRQVADSAAKQIEQIVNTNDKSTIDDIIKNGWKNL